MTTFVRQLIPLLFLISIHYREFCLFAGGNFRLNISFSLPSKLTTIYVCEVPFSCPQVR